MSLDLITMFYVFFLRNTLDVIKKACPCNIISLKTQD